MATPKALLTDHPHVEKNQAVCGGDPVITGTRIPIRLLYLRARAGDSVETIQQVYPGLSLAQIYDALSYAHDHLPEIETEIQRENEAFSQGTQGQSR